MEKTIKKYHILELNNIDIYGKSFNGYSLVKYINKTQDVFTAKQIVNTKLSQDEDVIKLFNNGALNSAEYGLLTFEEKILQAKNQISVSGPALLKHPEFKKADLLHFHMYHNMCLPITLLERIPKNKKIIIDIHDTFWLTDDCSCDKCQKARKNNPPINMLEVFDYCNPNAHSLSMQRKRVLESIDADFVVHSPYMLDLFKKSSITKNLKKVHLIPLGIDLNKYQKNYDQNTLKEKYKIPKNNLVLFCRAQQAFKGTKYIKQALAKTNLKNLTIITVSETGLLDSLKDKIQVIDFGQVKDEKKLTELYYLCDIFLAPSTAESFGIMPVEAMAAAKPVIVFDGTALPNTTFAPDCGYLVPSRDAIKLREAIEDLASNKNEQNRRGQLGRELAFKHYDLTSSHQATIDLYIKIIGNKNRNPKSTKSTKGNQDTGKVDYNSQEVTDTLNKFNQLLYDSIQSANPKDNIIMKVKRKIRHVANKIH